MDQSSNPVTLLRENIWEDLHDIEFGNVFLNMTPKAQVTTGKNRYISLYHNEKGHH